MIYVFAAINILTILWAAHDTLTHVTRSRFVQVIQFVLWMISGVAIYTLGGGMEVD